MQHFFKYVFATVVGILAFIALCAIVLIGMAFSGGSNKDQTYVQKNTVLKVDLNRTIQELEPADDPFEAFSGSSGPKALGIVNFKKLLENAAADTKISGIYLDAAYPEAGWATLEEVREALITFKKSKKFIYSYAETQSEKGYYLASVADKIYLMPAGEMELNGLSVKYQFFKGLFEKLNIKPEIFRVGKYKSAVEPYFLDKMSDENRQQTLSFAKDITDHYIAKMAEARKMPIEKMQAIVQADSLFTPEIAVKQGVITHAGYFDQFEADLKAKLGIKDSKKINYVSLKAYNKAERVIEIEDQDQQIAVVVAEGEIVSGSGSDGQIGSDKFVKALKKAREDKEVKAIVLRINSPGGSAMASDVMYREILLTKKTKPVVASMGDYAASGGYYLAAGADKIVAEPTTLTGSIGVFGVLFNIEGFLENKLGITQDRVDTHTFSDFPAMSRTMTDAEKAKLQNSTNRIYETFTALVAKSRKISQDSVKAIASGRVWTGKAAKAIGLVDEVGSYQKAIEIAATQAKLKPGSYNVSFVQRSESAFDTFMNGLRQQQEEEAIKKVFTPEMMPYYKALKKLETLKGVQARMPIEMSL